MINHRKIKIIIWIVIIAAVILGLNYWGTSQENHVNNVNDTKGIPKTHSIQVTHTKIPKRHHHTNPSYQGHLKDTPGNDNNPKKG